MLPEGLIEKYKSEFEFTRMYGVPLTKLTVDELRACLMVMNELYIKQMRHAQKKIINILGPEVGY